MTRHFLYREILPEHVHWFWDWNKKYKTEQYVGGITLYNPHAKREQDFYVMDLIDNPGLLIGTELEAQKRASVMTLNRRRYAIIKPHCVIDHDSHAKENMRCQVCDKALYQEYAKHLEKRKHD